MPKKKEKEVPEQEDEEDDSIDSVAGLFPPEGSVSGVGPSSYFGGSPVFFEPQFLCHWCGEKKGVGELIGRCVKCNKLLCDECVEYKGRRIYCADHAPRCFIATATFQSEDAPQVVTLREFRDHVLLKYRMGMGLVDFYYEVSPNLAAIIEKYAGLRKVFRTLLSPAIIIGRMLTRG